MENILVRWIGPALHRRLTRFLRISYQQKYYQPWLKWTEMEWHTGRLALRAKPQMQSSGPMRRSQAKAVGPPQQSRGQRITPERIILGLWNLMQFSLLGYELALDQWLPYSFHFLPFIMAMSFLCLSYHCILEANSNLFSRLHSRWEEILFRRDYSQRLTHIWFRLYKRWNLELFELITFRWDFGLRADAGRSWGFWRCWDGMDIFCTWEEQKF